MKKYNVGIIGATGAVGQEMIKILAERDFPIEELRLLASARSEGKVLSTPFGEITVHETKEDSFEGLDIVLVCIIPAKFRSILTLLDRTFVQKHVAKDTTRKNKQEM